MPFKIRVQYLDRDFQIHDEGVESWEVEVPDDAGMVIFLNRVAIASSQTSSIEHPLLEISVGTKRATVTAIKGQLFFSDLNNANIQNIRVIAEEIVGFLTDRIRPGSQEMVSDEDETWQTPRYRDQGRRTAEAIRAAAFAMLLAVLFFSAFNVWKTVSRNPRLVHHPDFAPGLPQPGVFLDRISGVYVDEVRDAGQVIEIDANGRFRLYELWRIHNGEAYRINQIEDLPAEVGMSSGNKALLAADYYLVVPDGQGRVSMFGQTFKPYDRKRDPSGIWRDPEN